MPVANTGFMPAFLPLPTPVVLLPRLPLPQFGLILLLFCRAPRIAHLVAPHPLACHCPPAPLLPVTPLRRCPITIPIDSTVDLVCRLLRNVVGRCWVRYFVVDLLFITLGLN